jgi:hypothetical protein
MAINLIDVGATANDGTGDPIRSAFQTVNDNFDFINGGLFAGSESSLISAINVTGGFIVSNTYVLANTYVNASSIVGNTVTSYGNLYVTQGGAYIVGNVNIIGNLSVSGSQAASQSQSSSSSILNLHYSETPFVLDDSRDIGLEWQYYKDIEQKAFLGWQNSTRSLVYIDNITESAGNVITAGSFGNVQFGSLLLSNTTSSTSNVTGALQVKGGTGIEGNLYVKSNVFVGDVANIGNITVRGYHVGSLNFAGPDTIFINGSPVQTAATAFNGGTVGLQTIFADSTQSTSTSIGAVVISTGGLGVGGNIWSSNIHVVGSGNVRANIIGSIITPSQPFITGLGTLTGLSVTGQINSRNIVPETNLTYSLGLGGTTRWSKIWGFDTDFSGAMTLSGVLTSTANININRSGVAGINTTTTIAEIFNNTATIVRIGGGGRTEFDSNTQSTSTTTGAVVIQGGASITTGNLYIGGSGGRAITHTGDIIPSANLQFNLGSATAWYGTFYGVSTQAKYADLAEKYVADKNYEVGTVVVFGGEEEITVTNEFADPRVAGVISENPAYLMNAMIDGLPLALRGRVPVRVVGPVDKGDLLVTSTTFGYARSVGRDDSYNAAVFAKSLVRDSNNGTKIIEAVII